MSSGAIVAAVKVSNELKQIEPADLRIVLSSLAHRREITDNQILKICCFALCFVYGVDKAPLEAAEWRLVSRARRPA